MVRVSKRAPRRDLVVRDYSDNEICLQTSLGLNNREHNKTEQGIMDSVDNSYHYFVCIYISTYLEVERFPKLACMMQVGHG